MQPEASNSIYGFYDLDAIDRRIIDYLQKNGRESFSRIAEDIGVPSSTVRDRTHRMVESGALQIVARLNPVMRERNVTATLGIKLSGGDYRSIAAEIARFHEATHVIICAGRFDLLVELTCKNNELLLDKVSEIQAFTNVQHIETFMHFSTVKDVLEEGVAAGAF